MTTDDKIKYAIEHPDLGRDKLAQVLGIGVSEARELVGFRKHSLLINNRNMLSTENALCDWKEKFYKLIPKTFTTQEAYKLAKELNVSESSIKLMLRNEKPYKHIRQGMYEKQQNIIFENKNLLANDVLKYLGTGAYSITDIANRFDTSPARIENEIKLLKEQGYLVNPIGDKLTAGDSIDKASNIRLDYKKHGEQEICIGILADTHLCCKDARLDVLNALYDRYADYGIKDVYLAGNWIEGEARFNKNNLLAHGIQNQIDYFIDNYPQRAGITSHILSGDDHEGWYVQRENINIGRFMETEAKRQGRDDLIDIGYMERDIDLIRKGGQSTMRIIHAGGGSAYALSYTTQKYNISLQGGEKPSIVFVGHYHKFDYHYDREIHTAQVGCVCDQTPFMRKKRLQAHLGGCVAWIKQADNGIITSFKLEWIPFYDKKFYEYQW